MIKNIYIALFCCVLSACSVMGGFAKSTFFTAQESWSVQPQAVRDSYPLWVQKKFYTSELLLTPITKWKIRIVSDEDILTDVASGNVTLSYQLDDKDYKIRVPLTLETTKKSSENNTEFYYIYSIIQLP